MSNEIRRQKIILLLIEGESDRKSFLPFENYIKKTIPGFKESFKIKINMIREKKGEKKGGDITTNPNYFQWASRSSQIDDKISEAVQEFLDDPKNTHLVFDDIAEIIQVVDMDGAYIPDSNILPMNKSEKESYPEKVRDLYYDNTIHSRYYDPKSGPYLRNLIKREALDHLVHLQKIKVRINEKKRNIPYRVYFMSCNLEHFLYNERNCSFDEKIAKATALMIAYSGSKAIRFAEVFDWMKIPEMKDYKKSWDYIRENNLHSLTRCSNALLISDLCKELTDGVLGEQNNG